MSTATDGQLNVDKKEDKVSVEDEIVNRFITEYNNVSVFDISNISKGNIKTKYFGYSNDCYLEMINAYNNSSKAFSLVINGSQKEETVDKVFLVYKDSVTVLDPTLTETQINDNITSLKNGNVKLSVGEKISVSYYPIKELSSGKTKCRIDIMAY